MAFDLSTQMLEKIMDLLTEVAYGWLWWRAGIPKSSKISRDSAAMFFSMMFRKILMVFHLLFCRSDRASDGIQRKRDG